MVTKHVAKIRIRIKEVETTFKSVNCNNLTVKNTKQQVTKTSSPTFTLSTSTSQITYLNFSNIGYINLGPLNEACNFNIYEFRILSSGNDVVFVAFNSAIVIDLDNVSCPICISIFW